MPSVAENLATAIGLLVEPIATPIPLVIRKQPDRVDGDPDDIVIVSVTEDDAEAFDFEDTDRVTYTAVVVRVNKAHGKLMDGATNRQWKQDTRRALRRPDMPAVTEINGSELVRGQVFPRPGTEAGFNYTPVIVRYESVEAAV